MIALSYALLLSSAPLSALIFGVLCRKSPRLVKKYLLLYIFCMAVLAYSCMPNYENDLIRYFNMIERCKSLPFKDAFTWGDDGLVVKNLIYWLISRWGDVHVLPGLAAAIIYGVAAYIAADQSECSGKALGTVLIFQLLSIPFFESISNVRNVSAFALIILAVYRDVVKRERDLVTALLYVLPCFIHIAGFILILFRFAALVFRKHPILGTGCVIGIPSLAIYIFNSYRLLIYNIGGNIGLILTRAINKAYASNTNTSEYAVSRLKSGYFNSCRAVNLLILACFLVMSIQYCIQMRKQKQIAKADFSVFVMFLCDITILWIIMGTVKYWVFAAGTYFACAPILLHYLASFKNRKLSERLCLYGIQIGALMRFGLEIYFMCRRVMLPEFFSGMLLNNAYTILWRVLSKLLA